MVTTRQVLIWLCMHPDNSQSQSLKWGRVARFLLPSTIFIFHLCMIASFAAFLVKFASSRMEDSLFTLMGLISSVGIANIMIIAFFARHQTPIVFKKLATIYAASEYFEAKIFE